MTSTVFIGTAEGEILHLRLKDIIVILKFCTNSAFSIKDTTAIFEFWLKSRCFSIKCEERILTKFHKYDYSILKLHGVIFFSTI